MIFCVAYYEFLFTVKRRGYLIATFGMPLILFVYASIVWAFSAASYSGLKQELEKPVGIVDYSGILSEPGALLEHTSPGETFLYVSPQYYLDRKKQDPKSPAPEIETYRRKVIPYLDFPEAQTAYVAGEVKSIVVIAKDYLASAEITLYKNPNPVLNLGGIFPVNQLLNNSLIKRGNLSAHELRRIEEGAFVKEFDIDETGRTSGTDPLSKTFSFSAPLGISVVLIMALMMNSGLLVSSVVQEKENKVIEIVLSSITPNQLLFGKVLGLVAAGLLQILVWMSMVGTIPFLWFLAFSEHVSLQVNFLQMILALIFGVLGLLLYGVVFAGLGSLGNTERDTRYISTFALLSSGLPLLLGFPISLNPNGTIARIVSYIPFFTPSALILRTMHGQVPSGEIILALCLLVISLWLATIAAARIFRAGVLLQGKRITISEIIRAIRVK